MDSKLTFSRIIKIVLLIATAITIFCVVKAQYKKNLKYAAMRGKENQTENLVLEGLVHKLKIYTIYDQNGPIELKRYGSTNDGGYIIPEVALSAADVLLGYGVAYDISFEERFSDIYKKPSYGFDCGIESIKIKNKLCNFVRECIASDSSIQGNQTSSQKVSTFSEQVERLGLKDKKLFIKMDIEGSEYDAFEDIFKYTPNITGIALELHFGTAQQALKASNLLSRLSENFLLVHVHANNCCYSTFSTKYSKGDIARVLELTFINKALVTKYELSKNQSHPTALDSPNCPNDKDPEFGIFAD